MQRIDVVSTIRAGNLDLSTWIDRETKTSVDRSRTCINMQRMDLDRRSIHGKIHVPRWIDRRVTACLCMFPGLERVENTIYPRQKNVRG